MHFEGEFRVPGKADDVMRRFADVPRMARCMPGAMLEAQAEDGSWPGTMVVAFGPKKIAFKGRVTCEFDFAANTGTLHGRGTADMRAARIGVKLGFSLHDGATPDPTTVVRITSDAELGGVLADFARTGGVAVANVIMQDFAHRAADEFASDAPPAGPREQRAPSDTPVSPTAVPASALPAATPDPARATGTLHPAPRQPAMAPPSATPPPTAPPAALSAHGVLWAVLRQQLRRFAQWLGVLAKDT